MDITKAVGVVKSLVLEKASGEEYQPMLFLFKGSEVNIVGFSSDLDLWMGLRLSLEKFNPDAYVLLFESRLKIMPISPEGVEEVRNYKRGDLQKDPESRDCIVVYGVVNGGESLATFAEVQGQVPERRVLSWEVPSGLEIGRLIVRKW